MLSESQEVSVERGICKGVQTVSDGGTCGSGAWQMRVWWIKGRVEKNAFLLFFPSGQVV